jgi:hypothetical protein
LALASAAKARRYSPSLLITVFLWAVNVQSASPHESQLVEEVVGQSFLDELPERLMGGTAGMVQLGCIKILLRPT